MSNLRCLEALHSDQSTAGKTGGEFLENNFKIYGSENSW
jgi:hypothetical protein